MKRMNQLAAIFIIALVSVAFSADLKSTSNEVDELRNAYQEAFNRGDLDFLMTCYAPTADVVNPGGKFLRGHTEIKRDLEEVLSSGGRPKLMLSSDSIRFLSSNIVVDDGTSKLSGADPRLPSDGRYTAILMKTDGNWKLISLRSVVLPRQD